MTSELKSLQTSRTETERGRKRAEGQLQELGARLAQADREREEREERLHKLQVLLFLADLFITLSVLKNKKVGLCTLNISKSYMWC